jgi:hypothetical protein
LLSEVQLEMRRGSRGSARGLGEARRAWTQADLAGALAGLGRGGTSPALVRAGLAARPPGGADGRLARLLVAFHLRAEGCLRQPRLCLSSAFARRHAEYSRLLLSRSVDSVAPWLRFFLECVLDAALRGTETLRRVLRLREEHRALVTTELKNSTSGVELLDQLIDQPVVTVQLAQKLLDRSYAAANDLVAGFEGLGLLRETTGGTRNRLFQYAPYMSVFEEASVSVAPPVAATSVEGDLSPRG